MNSARAQVERIARRLGSLRRDLAFVGGAAVELLLTDATPLSVAVGASPVELVARPDHYGFPARLRALGFREEGAEGAPAGRWIVDGSTLALLSASDEPGSPTAQLAQAFHRAQEREIAPGTQVLLLSGPDLAAVQLERLQTADASSPSGNVLTDLLALVDGRPGLVAECASAPAPLRTFLGRACTSLLASSDFSGGVRHALMGVGAEPERMEAITTRLSALAALA